MDLLVSNKNFTVPEVLLFALIGFTLVIIVLFFLMGIIKLLSYIVSKMVKKEKVVPAEAKEEPTAPGRSGEIKLFDVPDKEAAMVMAIVADKLQAPLSTLNFISIKEVKDGKEE